MAVKKIGPATAQVSGRQRMWEGGNQSLQTLMRQKFPVHPPFRTGFADSVMRVKRKRKVRHSLDFRVRSAMIGAWNRERSRSWLSRSMAGRRRENGCNGCEDISAVD